VRGLVSWLLGWVCEQALSKEFEISSHIPPLPWFFLPAGVRSEIGRMTKFQSISRRSASASRLRRYTVLSSGKELGPRLHSLVHCASCLRRRTRCGGGCSCECSPPKPCASRAVQI